jgi:DNA-binding CsgD family transcriptional regulator
MLYGRQAELSLLSDLTARGRTGGGAALVLRGEAGSGKTALLEAARHAAIELGDRTLSAVGVQSEASVPYAGLHQLLKPILDRAPDLIARQRQALLAAFGMAEGSAPEMVLVALAALELISNAAEDAPVVLVIDDVQWIDKPSSEVLAFIARRLDTERVVMLLAVRDGQDTVLDDAGLRELFVPGLEQDAAVALLQAHAPSLAAGTQARVIAEAAGNPLALIELPAALRGLASAPQPLTPLLPITRRLERAFLARFAGLPEVTQTMLLIAAADDECDLGEILHASQLAGVDTPVITSLEHAADAGLIDMLGREIRFRHPLIRSAIYQSASESRRHAAHAALATALNQNPERRAWHRAAATLGPDEDVAHDLEAAAEMALRRGAAGAAAEILRRAATLSSPETSRGRLLLRSAEINFELGKETLARQQLAEARPTKLREAERLRLILWSEARNEQSFFNQERVDALTDVADQLAGADSNGAVLALRALWPLSAGCWFGNPRHGTRDMVVELSRRLQRSDNDPLVLSIAAYADPIREAARVLEKTAEIVPESVDDPAEQHTLGAAMTAIWAFDRSWPWLCAAVDGLRTHGRLGLVADALASQSWSALLLGKYRSAATAADESSRLLRDFGRPRWALLAELTTAMLAGERGDHEAAIASIRTIEAELVSLGAQSLLSFAQVARGRCALARHQYADAYDELARTLDPSDTAHNPFVGYYGIADLIEAGVLAGRSEEAGRYLSELETLAEKTTAPYLLAMAAYARPLVACDEEAEPLYQRALQTDLSSWPLHRARLSLAYGRWLRRRRRLLDARPHLRTALESLDALGATALGDDARAELRAAGETVDRRTPATVDQLTPQELQIAKLAAVGMTNREIGMQLFLSHRTVGYHLYRIFPKLGITARSQLRTADLGAD